MAKDKEDEPQEGRDDKGRFTEKNLWTKVYSMHGGRPKIYDNPESFILSSNEYFEWCDKNDKGKYTYAGLRLFMGLSRQSWFNYKNRPEFFDAVDHIESRIEDLDEKRLGWNGSAIGAQFRLKNKSGWKDESEVTQNQNVTQVTIVEKTRDK